MNTTIGQSAGQYIDTTITLIAKHPIITIILLIIFLYLYLLFIPRKIA